MAPYRRLAALSNCPNWSRANVRIFAVDDVTCSYRRDVFLLLDERFLWPPQSEFEVRHVKIEKSGHSPKCLNKKEILMFDRGMAYKKVSLSPPSSERLFSLDCYRIEVETIFATRRSSAISQSPGDFFSRTFK
ncbi:hypothetical protein PUN28_010618 [Cardiocondyla obscurior]|uniref:Uncharacterized protein n=1 Tax=Cardiocondyla obscurior TaxID=286306 RepID=A0AAW2FI50_9HYME